MTIDRIVSENSVLLAPAGRLDAASAPELEKEIDAVAESKVKELILDLKDLSYTSSAGLRVILKAQKLMNAQGSMKVIHVSSEVMEIFDMTGFGDILTIE